MNQRYSRQTALPEVGEMGQAKIAGTSVLVVGAGGLGCPVLSYLVGAGIGHIILMDDDRIELSNLHRQVLYDTDDVGQFKAETAAAKLFKFNPECHVEANTMRLTPSNADLFVAKADIVVDAADSLAVTFMLSDAAMAAGKPLVSASIAGLKGYVGVFCAGAPSYRAVFPEMPQQLGNCATTGVIGSTVGVLGSLQAQMVLKLALGSQPSPAGKIVTIDFQTFSFGGFSFVGAPEPFDGLHFIDATQFRQDDIIVDLRSVEEAPVVVSPGAYRSTVNEIDDFSAQEAKDKRFVLCCRSGLRAWRAARKLQGQGFNQIVLVAIGG